MKRLIKGISILCCLGLVLSGCGASGGKQDSKSITANASKLEGTWIVDKVKTEDGEFTVDELEKRDMCDYIGAYIIFKKGGACQYFLDGYLETDEWEHDDVNVTVGYEEFTFSNSVLSYKDLDEKVTFKKYSNSQTFKNPYKYSHSESDLVGTWELSGAIINGSKFSLEELKTVDEGYYTEIYLVLKEGGNGYVASSDDIDTTEWYLSKSGLVIGGHNYKYDKKAGTLTVVEGEEEYPNEQYILKRRSDSQDITKLPIDAKSILAKQAQDDEEDEDDDDDWDDDWDDYDWGDDD